MFEVKEINVKSIVLELYDLTQAVSIADVNTGEEISIQDLQDLFYQEVENLADLLGIDLEEQRKV